MRRLVAAANGERSPEIGTAAAVEIETLAEAEAPRLLGAAARARLQSVLADLEGVKGRIDTLLNGAAD